MVGIGDHNNRMIPRVQPGGNTGGGDELLAVADVAALQALATAGLEDGAGVNMLSVKDFWQLDKTSTLVADNITIVAAADGGMWIRKNLGDETWREQATWHINETTGDDENDGAAAGTPLETFAELMRRLGTDPVRIAMTVYIDSDLNQDCDITCRTDDDAGVLIIQGNAPTTIYSGTLTGVQAINAAAGNDGQVTDAAIPVSWTASGCDQLLIELTSGANAGAVAWLMRDLGAKTDRHSRFYNEGAGTVYPDPAIGDDYDVIQLTAITGRIRGLSGGCLTVELRDLSIAAAAGMSFENFGGNWQMFRCNVDGAGCRLSGAPRRSFSEPMRIYGTRIRTTNFTAENVSVNFHACFLARILTARGGGVGFRDSDTFLQYVDTPTRINMRECNMSIDTDATLGIFDAPAATQALWMAPSYAILEGYCWGSGNLTNYIFRLHPGSTVFYEAAFKPTAAGAVVEDCSIGDADRAYADIPFTNVNNLAQMTEF